MITRLIHWSIGNRFLVLLATVMLTAWGVVSMLRTPLDALPDLSDTQVIIRTSWPGQAPQIVENQVTYPLTTTMLSVPGAKAVRGYSLFGDSFVYLFAVMVAVNLFTSAQGPLSEALMLSEMKGDLTHYGLLRLWGSVGYIVVVMLAGWLQPGSG